MASRLLVADDSITIQKIVTMAFENEDMEVEGVGDGQEAFDRIPEFKPDIVLADVDMPGLDGFELSAKIKESMSSIKVLLLASDFEDFDEQRYQSCGADNHISKPFKSDDIITMVKGLLEGSEDEVVSLSGDDMVEEEGPLELTDAQVVEQPLSVEDIELPAKTVNDLKVPEFEEEPSLEELLESVEKLSIDGMDLSDEEDLAEPVSLAEEDEVVALTDEEIVEPLELPQPVEEVVSEEEAQLKTPEPEPEPEPELEREKELAVPTPDNDDDIMDQMIRGVEELRESVQSFPSEEEGSPFEEELVSADDAFQAEDLEFVEEPEIFAEIRSREMDDLDDLDSTFKEIRMGGRGPANHVESEASAELSSLGGIVPEPENLLESIAPGAFSEVGKRPVTPEDIKENLDNISGVPYQGREETVQSGGWSYEAEKDPFSQVIAEEVRHLLQRSLSTSLEKEVSGLSEAILKTVREVVREITPEIARKVIREEIEKIKKQDMS